MERRFDMTNFEQSLKDHADQLDMIPSKRVWNGIYNNLHPGSRWPSIAMAFVFLFTILGIGHLNNNTRKLADLKGDTQNQSEINSESQNELNSNKEVQEEINSESPVVKLNEIGNHKSENSSKENSIQNNLENEVSKSSNNPEQISSSGPVKTAKIISLYSKRSISETANQNDALLDITSNLKENPLTKVIGLKQPKLLNEADNITLQNSFLIASDLVKNDIPSFNINLLNSKDEVLLTQINVLAPAIQKSKSNDFLMAESKNNLNTAQKAAVKKRNEKINWLFYVTPTFTTASFHGRETNSTSNLNLSSLLIRRNQNKSGMIYNPILGFDLGTEITYTFWKKLQFITGTHLSYSGYNVVSNQVHPTFTSLMLVNETSRLPYSQSYITHYGNGQSQNQVSLTNYSFQISIPLGLQQALFENNRMKIDIASSFEPSFILKSNAFLISADERYYVQDADLLRKVNINGKIGAFVTFKANKVNWQLGPTIRYQLLSTYQKKYPVKEHFIDYGIRIGISKSK